VSSWGLFRCGRVTFVISSSDYPLSTLHGSSRSEKMAAKSRHRWCLASIWILELLCLRIVSSSPLFASVPLLHFLLTHWLLIIKIKTWFFRLSYSRPCDSGASSNFIDSHFSFHPGLDPIAASIPIKPICDYVTDLAYSAHPIAPWINTIIYTPLIASAEPDCIAY